MISTILLSAVFAGLVATLVTVAIEKFGGVAGGVLGTVPSTIVPASIGMLAGGGEQELLRSLSIIPLGMLCNALFLWSWIFMSKRDENVSLPLVTVISLVTWGILAALLVFSTDAMFATGLSQWTVATLGTVLLIGLAVWSNREGIPAPKGSRGVSLGVLIARGLAAAIAIAIAVYLSGLGYPLLAGIASVFPAIFLTSMVALWLAQGSQVPTGAAGPMMLGGVSVAIYAMIAMYSLPQFGQVIGSLVAWLGAVLLWSLPSFHLLRSHHSKVNL